MDEPYIFNQAFNLSSEGAVVTAWSEDGKHILFPRTWFYVNEEKKIRGGMHPCFPNFGAVDVKYGLPQHGPLRNVSGQFELAPPNAKVWKPNSQAGLLGKFNEECCIRVTTERHERGFTYRLNAELPPAAPRNVPIGAGLHPYFATPEGTATVSPYGVDRIEIKDLISEPITVPLTSVVTLAIPGVGKVEMSMEGALIPDHVNAGTSTARLVLWRDRLDYLCVEPVLAMGHDFGTERCPTLYPGESMEIGCTFRLL